MRLSISLLGTTASVNQYTKKSFVEISQGENLDLYFQLVDADQGGLRYMPAVGVTVYVEIPRFQDALATISNQRQIVDYSVRKFATQPFAQDGSIWKVALTSTETANMMSSSIRFTVTEGTDKKIWVVNQAIKVNTSEGTVSV